MFALYDYNSTMIYTSSPKLTDAELCCFGVTNKTKQNKQNNTWQILTCAIVRQTSKKL